MRTKLLAVGSTLLLVAGLISVGAGPASAHTETVKGNATCQTDATYRWYGRSRRRTFRKMPAKEH